MTESYIRVRGARQHNLKNIDLDIPKNKLVIFTGVSGSGKSSIAFDTIYAEGQRRYVESLSTYARQFLGIMEKPDVDFIEGLSPAISIDQKTTSRNPRSTVGTVTEIYDYLRLLFARVGHPHCPICGREIQSQSIDQIVAKIISILSDRAKTEKILRFLVLSPVVMEKKGEFKDLFENLRSKGFSQVRIDGHIKSLSDDFVLIKTNKHTIDAVIDKVSISAKDLKDDIAKTNLKSRLSESSEQALRLSDGLVIISEIHDPGFEMPTHPTKLTDHLFSEKFSCPFDNIQIPEIEPRTFSFNSPQGACPKCSGIGKIQTIDVDRIIAPELSLTEGGVIPFSNMFDHDTWYSRIVLKICEQYEINPRTPLKNLSQDKLDILLYGTKGEEYKIEGTNRQGRMTYIYESFKGFVNELERRYRDTESEWIRTEITKYMKEILCEECSGTRLKKEALGVTVDGQSIAEITGLSIEEASEWIKKLKEKVVLSEREKYIATPIITEIAARLTFLSSVGLNYLSLERTAGTLSGGEAQRIRLASQIGSGLTGVLYVLDEPTIGLHARDNQRLIDTLKKLRDLGNSVVVVEHDSEMMLQSDYIFDFGPGAGKNGGEKIAEGTPNQIQKDPKSITGLYLSGKKKIGRTEVTNTQLTTNNQLLSITGCSEHNLKNISVTLPLGKLVVFTGVSGSGKSTLLVETIYPAIRSKIEKDYRGEMGVFGRIEGTENIDKVYLIDQSPIGRTPRSNPATYTKIFDLIRDVFADTKDAKVMGFKKGRFSFNVKGGRCEACEGQGSKKIEMQFMSDIWVTCEVCKGRRYNSQTLEVMYKGKNIAEVLKMSVTEALEFFHTNPSIMTKLSTLSDVGLSYMELGQPATTLSGGEAQRVKLSTELSKKGTGKTLYILDEPTTGLHFADIEKLLSVIRILVSRGNSVFVIEHNIDIIKNADHIVDLGPDGGDHGGEIIAQGSVSDIKKAKASYTAEYI